jgi:hypothetical protein
MFLYTAYYTYDNFKKTLLHYQKIAHIIIYRHILYSAILRTIQTLRVSYSVGDFSPSEIQEWQPPHHYLEHVVDRPMLVVLQKMSVLKRNVGVQILDA